MFNKKLKRRISNLEVNLVTKELQINSQSDQIKDLNEKLNRLTDYLEVEEKEKYVVFNHMNEKEYEWDKDDFLMPPAVSEYFKNMLVFRKEIPKTTVKKYFVPKTKSKK